MSLQYDLYFLIDNKAALVQILAWHQAGDKPIYQPVRAYITDTYMHQSASVS